MTSCRIPRSPASPLFLFPQDISSAPARAPSHFPVPVNSGWYLYYSHVAESYLYAFPWMRRSPGLERARTFVVFCVDEMPQIVLFRDLLGHEVVYYASKGRVLVEGCRCLEGTCPLAPKPSYAQMASK
jgi:hypothetical protein